MSMFFMQQPNEDIGEIVRQAIEQNAQRKIQSLQIIGEEEDCLQVIVVFTDYKVLKAYITVLMVDGKVGCRIRGNYLN